MKYQTGNTKLAFILIAIAAIAIGVFTQNSFKIPADGGKPLPALDKAILLPNPKALGAVDFIDHKHQPFGLAQLQGKWSILFFGFTNCPDICPTTMQTLSQVKQDVSEAGLWGNYQVIMVSVDPERDSAERLGQYVPYFDPGFVGIAGTVEHTTDFAKNLGILFFKGDAAENGGYDVDHGAALILINPEGKMAGVIGAPHKREEISKDLIKLAEFSGTPAVSVNAAEPEITEPDTEQSIATDTLSLSKAWIRPAPPNANSMAAYFELVNSSDSNVTILAASSPDFENVMIHNTVIENGLASMEHLEELTVPANGLVTLIPLGKHLMLMRPKRPLVVGDTATITLVTDNGKQSTHSLSVRQQPTE